MSLSQRIVVRYDVGKEGVYNHLKVMDHDRSIYAAGILEMYNSDHELILQTHATIEEVQRQQIIDLLQEINSKLE